MMVNQEEEQAERRIRIPSGAVLREVLWLPKMSVWGIVGTILFVAGLAGGIVYFLVH
jgi:hypothetical protein